MSPASGLPLPVTLDASRIECRVFTEKEGLLSTVAHDLAIAVRDFEVRWDGETIEARFSALGLRGVSAMKGAIEDTKALTDADKQQIERSIIEDVLEAKRHPDITFRSRVVASVDEGFRIVGDLTLHGARRPIEITLRRDADRFRAELTLDQRDFGIRPFSAMLGTLKVKPEIRVALSLATDDLVLG